MFKIESLVINLSLANFKNADKAMVVEPKILIDLCSDFILGNFALREVLLCALLNDRMSFENYLNIGQGFILFLNLGGFPGKIKPDQKLSDQVQISIPFLLIVGKVNYVANPEIFNLFAFI